MSESKSTFTQISSPANVDSDTEITLGVLNAVHENSALTQRSVAGELGIALGLANAYVKRCVKKGLIKVNQIPPNRYAYYLTPQGFAEKSRLTAEYLSNSFSFFRDARAQCSDLFAHCAARNWDSVALCGIGDLGEIATLCARDYPVAVIGFLDDEPGASQFAGLPVVPQLSELGGVKAVIITDLGAPQEIYERLIEIMPAERVLAPRFLGISRDRSRIVE